MGSGLAGGIFYVVSLEALKSPYSGPSKTGGFTGFRQAVGGDLIVDGERPNRTPERS